MFADIRKRDKRLIWFLVRRESFLFFVNIFTHYSAQNKPAEMRKQRFEVILAQFVSVRVIDKQRHKIVVYIRASSYKIHIIIRLSYTDNRYRENDSYPRGTFYRVQKPPYGDAYGYHGDNIEHKITVAQFGDKAVEERVNAHKQSAYYAHFQHAPEFAFRKTAVYARQIAKEEKTRRLHCRAKRAVPVYLNGVVQHHTELRLKIEHAESETERTAMVERNENHQNTAENIQFPNPFFRTGIIGKRVFQRFPEFHFHILRIVFVVFGSDFFLHITLERSVPVTYGKPFFRL
jgi:hypothetical protein